MERDVADSITFSSGRLSRRSAIGLSLGALAAAGGGLANFVLISNAHAQTAAKSGDGGTMEVDAKTENIMGEPNAPVTIIEYSSMTCPHCATHHRVTMPALKEKYIKTGKVRYVLREFPLDTLAFAASALARCAGPEKYFPFVTALYKQQDKWAQGPGSPAPRLFKMAKQAGFNEDSFNACMRNKEVISHIEKSMEIGRSKYSVSSTPTLFVNGKKLEKGNSLADIEKAMAPYLGG